MGKEALQQFNGGNQPRAHEVYTAVLEIHTLAPAFVLGLFLSLRRNEPGTPRPFRLKVIQATDRLWSWSPGTAWICRQLHRLLQRGHHPRRAAVIRGARL